MKQALILVDIQNDYFKGGRHELVNTEGAEFYEEVCPLAGEEVIIKHRPDSFLGTGLREKLKENGIDVLIIGGMMTHMCIDTTVRAAAGYGYTVELIEDACTTGDLKWKGNTVTADQVQNAYMAALDGSFARVLKADAWIKEQK